MSILEKWRQWRQQDGGERRTGDTETVRKIVRELDALEPSIARYVASFAYILGRAAHADLEISDVETIKMEEIVASIEAIGAEHAVLVVQMAKTQNRLFGGTENFLVTREFRALSTRQQRIELLRCLFAVSAADESISGVEEQQIRQIASELDLTHRDYVDVRAEFSAHRDVLKGL